MNFVILFNVSLITVVFVLYLYFKWSFTYWSRRGVNAFPANFPLGNLGDVAVGRASLQDMFHKLYTTFKPKGIRYAGYYLMNKPVLAVFDTELIKSVLVKDFLHFTDHGFLETKDYDVYSAHLFGMKGQEWKKMREKLSPLFTSGKLKVMFPTIQNSSLELINLIEKAVGSSEVLDIKDIAGRYTTDIIASVAFGIESNTLKNPVSDFRKYGERAVGNSDLWDSLNLFLQLLVPDLLTLFKIPLLQTDITNFFVKIVDSTIKYREDNKVVRKDFLQLMIQLKNNADISNNDNNCFNLELPSGNTVQDKNEASLSLENIVAQTILFFIAGYDTSSVTISFCMYELAFHQEIQDKLRQEINNVLKNHAGELSYNAIMEMTYMDKCIKETLRKYPILSFLFRKCIKAYKVSNSDLIIEKDQMVLIPVQELHYDTEYFPNPEKFDPNRFSTENIAKRQSFTYLPFGEGARVCLGARLAMVQIKVALTKLLMNFRYTLDSRTLYPLKKAPRSVVVAAKDGLWLHVEKITS